MPDAMKNATSPTFSWAKSSSISNDWIAEKLQDFADLLHQQGEEGFGQRAYRNAAAFVADFERPLAEVLAMSGRQGLIELPTIGNSIAGAIAEMLLTGRWMQLERLTGDLSPEKLFATIPGVGPVLAQHLVEDGGLETLQDLETAIHRSDFHVRGIGPRRRKAIAAILAQRLGRPIFPEAPKAQSRPSVATILQVDAMYFDAVRLGKLPKIAPRRFNPGGRQWLPIMHTELDGFQFTALFSNTARAHDLGKTDDWVIIAYRSDHAPEGQCTVVTETHGPRTGQRVVRGREQEMLDLPAEIDAAEERRHMLT